MYYGRSHTLTSNLMPSIHVCSEKIAKAKLHPAEFITILMDGSDQSKSGIPQEPEIRKADGNVRLRSHLMIAMTYNGKDEAVNIFDTIDNIFRDSNLTIECLHRSLVRHQDKFGGFPKNLNLQMDNCVRENKNSYLFAFLAWLVERRVFVKIYLSFLPVGHTHFKPDQVASRVSVAVKHNAFSTRAQFHNLLKTCTTPRPHVEQVFHVADCKQMFNPELSDTYDGSTIDRPAGLTGPLHFRYELDERKCVAIRCKKAAAQEVWSGSYYLFKGEDDAGNLTHASGFDFARMGPSVFKPVPQTRLDLIEKNLIACRSRSGEESFAVQMVEFQQLVEPVPIPFHWVNEGKYRCELGEEDSASDDEIDQYDSDGDCERRGLPLRPEAPLASSRYRLLTESVMQFLCIGHFVIVDSRGNGTGTDWRYYLGRVIKYDVCHPKQLTIIRYVCLYKQIYLALLSRLCISFSCIPPLMCTILPLPFSCLTLGIFRPEKVVRTSRCLLPGRELIPLLQLLF